MKKKLLSGLAVGLMAFGIANAQANTIELALVLDGSGSISPTNWALQVNAYHNIFTDSNFMTDMGLDVSGDTLWVKAYQFSTGIQAEPTAATGWLHITDNATAAAFGNYFTLANFTQIGQLTNTEAAIRTPATDMLNNSIASDKMVIDISTDGEPTTNNAHTSNSTTALNSAITAAADAKAADVTVNLIGVGSIDAANMTSIAAAGGGFYMNTPTYELFEASLKNKLYREITGNNPVPEPATMLLMGTGLAGLIGARRKKKA